MLKSEYYIEDIKEQIAIFQNKIGLETSLNHHNLKLYGENFFRDILNIIYPKANFTNTNFLESNFPAIDLICHETEKCIQITSNRTRDKIKDTIKAYKKSQYSDYEIEIYYLLEKAKPNNIKDLEKELKIEDLSSKLKDSSNLMKDIDNLEVKELEQVWKLFKIDNEVISFLTQLKERYTTPHFTKLKPLSSLNKDVYLQDIYQDLSIIKKKKNEEEKDKEINIDELLNESKKVSILGKSGIGKSTLAKYICYQWANGKLFNNYDYLFYIPIKKWEKGEGIFDVVLKVLKESINENINIKSDDLYEYIKSSNNETLFVIDGFDEIKNEYREEIKKEIQNFDNYIITSRHNGLKENELNIENTFENEGFNQKSIENFIKHISNSAELIKQINNNSQLEELSKIPMLLDMICYLYKGKQLDFNSDFTMTALYEKFLLYMIRRLQKERSKEYDSISKEINEVFIELGNIAFEKLKTKEFQFKGEKFINFSNYKLIEKELLPFGLLTSITNEEYIEEREYAFIHTSFQEYFSAFYVASLPEEKQSEIIRDWKFYPHMQMFFAFLGGLIRDKEFLLGEIESEPRDELGLYEISLILNILTEIEKNKISKDRINYINLIILKWLESSTFYKYKSQYIFLAKNLFIIYEFISQEVIDYFYHNKKDIFLSLMTSNFIKSNNKIKNELINYIKEEKVDLTRGNFQSQIEQEFLEHRKARVLELLASIHENDERIIELMINFMESTKNYGNKNISIKKFIAEILVSIGARDDKILKRIISIIKNQKISLLFNREPLVKLLITIVKNNDIVIDSLIDFIKIKNDNEAIDYICRESVAKLLLDSQKENDKVIKQFSSMVEDESVDIRDYIAKLLANTKRDDEKTIKTHKNKEELITNKLNYNSFWSFNGENPYNRVLNNQTIIRNNITHNSQTIKKIFNATDFNLDTIIENALLNNLPLYSKNNKLCTVEARKEISTQREIDEATLNEIKMLIKGDDLND